jgi:hypothetical protein
MFTSELFLLLANQFIDAHQDAIYSAVFLSFRFSFDRYSLSRISFRSNDGKQTRKNPNVFLWDTAAQRLDNKKNNRLDSGMGDGLGADAHFPLSKMNGDELTHWVNVFPPTL